MKLLLTGFDPFGGERVNPAWEAAKLLPHRIGPWEIVKTQVPTVFGLAAEKAVQKAEEERADAVLCLGQAGGRDKVTPEMTGVNWRYAAIPDNAGAMPRDVPIFPGAPNAYFSTLPFRAMARAICDAGLPGAVSYSAGVFVCNDLLYTLLRHFDQTPVRAGFIHVPFLPCQGSPSLPLEDTVRALQCAISAMI